MAGMKIFFTKTPLYLLMDLPRSICANIQAVSSHITNESLLIKFLSNDHRAGGRVAQTGAGRLLESGGGKWRSGISRGLSLLHPENFPSTLICNTQDSFRFFLLARPL